MFENRFSFFVDGGYLFGDYFIGIFILLKFFIIVLKMLFFLGGGCVLGQIWVELFVDGKVVCWVFVDDC